MSLPASNEFAAFAFLLLLWFLVFWRREERSVVPDWWDSAKGKTRPAPASPTELQEANTWAGEHVRFVYAEPYSGALQTWLWQMFWLTSVAAGFFCADTALRVLGLTWFPDGLVPAFCALLLGFLLLMGLLGAARYRHRTGRPFFQRDRAIQSVENLAKAHPKLQAYLESLEGPGLPWWWVFGIGRRNWFRRMRLAFLTIFPLVLAVITFFMAWYGFWPSVLHRPGVDLGAVLLCVLSVGGLTFVHSVLQIQCSPWHGADSRNRSTFALAVLRDDFMGRFP